MRRLIAVARGACILTLVMLTGCGGPPTSRGPVPGAASEAVVLSSALREAPDASETRRVMRRVFDWQLGELETHEPDWIQATFMIGATAAYEATGDSALGRRERVGARPPEVPRR